jgi:hypothetical protein
LDVETETQKVNYLLPNWITEVHRKEYQGCKKSEVEQVEEKWKWSHFIIDVTLGTAWFIECVQAVKRVYLVIA